MASDVTYTACGWDRRLLGEPYGGAWLLASRILSYDFLWTEVRVKGGAYGAGFQTTRSGSSRFYSYRDPRIEAEISVLEGQVLDDKISSFIAAKRLLDLYFGGKAE